ncbi:MAG TPA: transglutaminase-like domain-containing protein [Ruminococcus sp.]|nr:transglutaminase-like domain-containing protein [Ruminococcus sp.]
MTITKNKISWKDVIEKTVFDPVLLYTVAVVMSIMYHYRDNSEEITSIRDKIEIGYGILTFIIGWVVFRLFDFVKKHKLIGGLLLIITYILFGTVADKAMSKGRDGYPISWGLWFMSPQDSVDYNKWYTVAMFILFCIFMLSVIYYFNRVRYRILMNFLIFLIPFAIYGKEYVKMPIGYIMILSVGYILLMIYSRQICSTDKKITVDHKEVWKSVTVYAVLFALFATLTPKPKIEADRTALETLVSADAFTDRLNAMLNAFRDTAGGNQFRNNSSNLPVYYVRSKDPMHLKTTTFSKYDYENDSWRASMLDKSIYAKNQEFPINIYGNGHMTEALLLAAKLDSGFAQKYGLEDLDYSELTLTKEREAKIYTVMRGGKIAPMPQSVQSYTDSSTDEKMTCLDSGLVYMEFEFYKDNETYTFNYTPDVFFTYDYNEQAAARFSEDDYADIVSDAEAFYESDAFLRYRETQSNEAKEYLDRLAKEVAFSDKNYEKYQDELLDYGDSKRIYELAQSITQGLETDYEKAKALEYYFYENNYVYDLEYRKKMGENVENFIFDSKTGVCYEYATAMTLLARAAGIPARYCEGYSVQEAFEGDESWNVDYTVWLKDAHGFPELYIRGFGWMDFEPTMTDQLEVVERESTTSLLSKAGIILLIAAVIALLFILVSPALIHKLFLMICRKRSPNDTVRGIIKRIYKLHGLNGKKTTHEASEYVQSYSGADMNTAADLFDKAVYGGAELDENEKQTAIDVYVKVYEAYKEARKNRRKKA